MSETRILSRIKNLVVPNTRKQRNSALCVQKYHDGAMPPCLKDQTQLYLGLFEREAQGWLAAWKESA
jgi:hypothetical protein